MAKALGVGRELAVPSMPATFQPIQEPKAIAKPPISAGWVHEIKYDGYRLQLNVRDGRPTLFTRRGFDWTARFPKLASEAARLPNCILDAELCAIASNGQPDFSALTAAIASRKTAGLVCFVFDLLWLENEDQRGHALSYRKDALADVLDGSGGDRLREVETFTADGPSLFASACRMGLEGIVSKNSAAPYRGGKWDSWVKAKCRPTQSVVICGWKQEPMRAFKALLVGVYDAGKLTYAGSIKTGFSGSTGLLAQLQALEVPASPLEAGDRPRPSSEIHWTRPELVAEVQIAEWTANGRLRQASFKGLRQDKNPRDVVRERPADA